MNKRNEPKLMSIREASKYLGIKESRLRKATRLRELPFMRVGRLIRFERDHLDQWINKKHQDEGGAL
ncbi:MAG: helix-turn-helix domain-containing protein [Bdellovibrionales bacterium]|nr:helix-turn-helix domain-containing protein [Bdellovibrionales bacterium]